MSVRIVIADDHPIFRDGLRRLLEFEPGLVVVGHAEDGDEAVSLVGALHPDILLLDLAMPRVPGLTTLERLASTGSGVRTILLTASIDKANVVAALHLGARGVVLKEATTDLLLKSIYAVIRGEYWVGSDSVANPAEALRTTMAGGSEDSRRHTFGLTKREFDVLGAIVSGLTNKDIARRFSVTEDTVKHHLTSTFNKTGVSTRLELALFAMHHKLAAPPVTFTTG